MDSLPKVAENPIIEAEATHDMLQTGDNTGVGSGEQKIKLE